MVKMYFPGLYVGPPQMPLAWRNDRSGTLPAAVDALHAYAVGPSKDGRAVAINEAQIELVRAYAIYFLKAPCWNWNNPAHPRDTVIQGIETATMPDELLTAIRRAIHVGIDVFA